MGGVRALAASVFSLAVAPTAGAGPPLVSDDPRTVGAGVVEVILAVDLLEQGDATSIAAPTVDLTVGLADGIDGTLVAAPVFDRADGSGTDVSEFVEVGLKWQPVSGERWKASASPTFTVAGGGDARFGIVLPLQLERVLGPALVGVDGGYHVLFDGDDAWRAGAWAGWFASERTTLLAEVWSTGSADGETGAVSLGLAVEWLAPFGAMILVSGGPGIGSWGGPRVDWRLYAGLKWTFEASRPETGRLPPQREP